MSGLTITRPYTDEMKQNEKMTAEAKLRDLIDELQKEVTNLREELLDEKQRYVQVDCMVENQKQVIKNVNKTLERYEKENKALRELVQLWI